MLVIILKLGINSTGKIYIAVYVLHNMEYVTRKEQEAENRAISVVNFLNMDSATMSQNWSCEK